MNPGGDRCEYDHNIFSEIIKELLKIDLKNSLVYLPKKFFAISPSKGRASSTSFLCVYALCLSIYL